MPSKPRRRVAERITLEGLIAALGPDPATELFMLDASAFVATVVSEPDENYRAICVQLLARMMTKAYRWGQTDEQLRALDERLRALEARVCPL